MNSIGYGGDQEGETPKDHEDFDDDIPDPIPDFVVGKMLPVSQVGLRRPSIY